VQPLDTNGDGLQNSQAEQVSLGDFTHEWQYNILNSVIVQSLDAGSASQPGKRLVTTTQYSANNLPVVVIKPEGNSSTAKYNERNLPVIIVEGASDTRTSGTTEITYTANGLVNAMIDDDNNSDPAIQFSFDLHDRMTSWTNENGTTMTRLLDKSGNPIREQLTGESNHFRSSFKTEVLWTKINVFDEKNCMCASSTTQMAEFIGISPALRPEETVERKTRCVRSATCETLISSDTNGNESSCEWNGAGFVILHTDAMGNVYEYVYDADFNLIEVKSVEFGSEQRFVSRAFYDSLGRPVAQAILGALPSSTDMDPQHQAIGNVTRMLYDSRGLVTSVTDANGPTSSMTASSLDRFGPGGVAEQPAFAMDPVINAPGNRARMEYDNLGRLLRSVREMTNTGIGGDSVHEEIVTSQVYDDNSRVIARTDPNGNTTQYRYDQRDRMIEEIKADNARIAMTYDRMSNLLSRRDERGVMTVYGYDALERMISEDISGLPVGDQEYQTTFRRYTYDGLNRMKSAADNDSLVELFHDQLGLVREERQTIGNASRSSPSEFLNGEARSTTYDYDGSGALKAISYPKGGLIFTALDALNRPSVMAHTRSGLNSSNPIARFEYIGNRLKRETYENGTATDYQYDGAKRLVRVDQRNTTTNQRISGFNYEYDRVGNRRFERELTRNTDPNETQGMGSTYRYDSSYRLITAEHDVSSASLNTVQANTAGDTGLTSTTNRFDAYAYDPAGNRLGHTRDGITTPYIKGLGDFARNQYSAVGALSQFHDLSGNNTGADLNSGQETREFDDQNRLTKWQRSSTVGARYRYDAFGRRISKEWTDFRVKYWRGGSQVLNEESVSLIQLGDGYSRRYFYAGLDRPIKQQYSSGPFTVLSSAYYGRNSLGSVTALSDINGQRAEGYTYRPFGETSVFNANGNNITNTNGGQGIALNPYRFQGRRQDFDDGSSLYHFRNRYYSAEQGRFVSKDPKGDFGDGLNMGNGQAFCGNNPVNRVDPFGLDGEGLDIVFDPEGLTFNRKKQSESWRTESWELEVPSRLGGSLGLYTEAMMPNMPMISFNFNNSTKFANDIYGALLDITKGLFTLFFGSKSWQGGQNVLTEAVQNGLRGFGMTIAKEAQKLYGAGNSIKADFAFSPSPRFDLNSSILAYEAIQERSNTLSANENFFANKRGMRESNFGDIAKDSLFAFSGGMGKIGGNLISGYIKRTYDFNWTLESLWTQVETAFNPENRGITTAGLLSVGLGLGYYGYAIRQNGIDSISIPIPSIAIPINYYGYSGDLKFDSDYKDRKFECKLTVNVRLI